MRLLGGHTDGYVGPRRGQGATEDEEEEAQNQQIKDLLSELDQVAQEEEGEEESKEAKETNLQNLAIFGQAYEVKKRFSEYSHAILA